MDFKLALMLCAIMEIVYANNMTAACQTCCGNSTITKLDAACDYVCNTCLSTVGDCSYFSIRGTLKHDSDIVTLNEYWRVSRDECQINMEMDMQFATATKITCNDFQVFQSISITYSATCIKEITSTYQSYSGTATESTHSTTTSGYTENTQSTIPTDTENTQSTIPTYTESTQSTTISGQTESTQSATISGYTEHTQSTIPSYTESIQSTTISSYTEHTQSPIPSDTESIQSTMAPIYTETTQEQSDGLSGGVVAIIVVLTVGVIVVALVIVLIIRRKQTQADVQGRGYVNYEYNINEQTIGGGPLDSAYTEITPERTSNAYMQTSNGSLVDVSDRTDHSRQSEKHDSTYAHGSSQESNAISSEYASIDEYNVPPNRTLGTEHIEASGKLDVHAISSEYASIDEYNVPPNRTLGAEHTETSGQLDVHLNVRNGVACTDNGKDYTVLYRANTERHDYQVLGTRESKQTQENYTYAKVNKNPKENQTQTQKDYTNAKVDKSPKENPTAEESGKTNSDRTYFLLDKHDIEVKSSILGDQTWNSEEKCNDGDQSSSRENQSAEELEKTDPAHMYFLLDKHDIEVKSSVF